MPSLHCFEGYDYSYPIFSRAAPRHGADQRTSLSLRGVTKRQAIVVLSVQGRVIDISFPFSTAASPRAKRLYLYTIGTTAKGKGSNPTKSSEAPLSQQDEMGLAESHRGRKCAPFKSPYAIQRRMLLSLEIWPKM